jgi:hypothetical protein
MTFDAERFDFHFNSDAPKSDLNEHRPSQPDSSLESEGELQLPTYLPPKSHSKPHASFSLHHRWSVLDDVLFPSDETSSQLLHEFEQSELFNAAGIDMPELDDLISISGSCPKSYEEYSAEYDENQLLHGDSEFDLQAPLSPLDTVTYFLNRAIEQRTGGELAASRNLIHHAIRQWQELSEDDEVSVISADELTELQGEILIELANQMLELEDLLSACRFARYAFHVARKSRMIGLEANALATLGVIVGLDDQFELSFQMLRHAADRHRALDDQEGYVIDLMNMGELLTRSGHLDTAAILLEKSIKTACDHELISLYIRGCQFRHQIQRLLAVKNLNPELN